MSSQPIVSGPAHVAGPSQERSFGPNVGQGPSLFPGSGSMGSGLPGGFDGLGPPAGSGLPALPPAGAAFPEVLSPGGAFPWQGTAGTVASSAATSPLSLNKLQEIKTFVDRMGGIDGIIGTIGKVQKMVASVQQMAPMLKVIMGSFGKKAAVNTKPSAYPRRRRPTQRRRRRRSGGGTASIRSLSRAPGQRQSTTGAGRTGSRRNSRGQASGPGQPRRQ